MRFFYRYVTQVLFCCAISILFVRPSFAVLNPVTASQGYPNAVYNFHDDQFLIVWGECRNIPPGGSCSGSHPYSCGYGATNASDIFGQIVKGDGSCVGGNFLIAGGTTGQELPGVTYNPDNHEYLVVWQGHKYDFVARGEACEGDFQNKGYDVFGQRLSVGGQKIGTQFHISRLPGGNPETDNDDENWRPKIAYSQVDKTYMVVWHDGRVRRVFSSLYSFDTNDGTTFKDIYGQIVKADGTLQGENFPVAIDARNTVREYKGNAVRIQQYPDITYDSTNNRFMVVWEDDREEYNYTNQTNPTSPHPPGQEYDRLDSNIWGGFFNTSGAALGANFKIGEAKPEGKAQAERYAQVVYNPHYNEFMILWQAVEIPNPPFTGAYPGDYAKAYGQRINANGEKIGSMITFETQAKLHTAYYNNTMPPQIDVTINTQNNNYFVTWGKSGGGNAFTIYSQELDPSNGNLSQKNTISNAAYVNKIYYRNKPTAYGYFSIQAVWTNNMQAVTFKTQSMGESTNCPASGALPSTTPWPTATIGPTNTPGGPTNTPGGPTVTPNPSITVFPTVSIDKNKYMNYVRAMLGYPYTASPSLDLNSDGLITPKDLELMQAGE